MSIRPDVTLGPWNRLTILSFLHHHSVGIANRSSYFIVIIVMQSEEYIAGDKHAHSVAFHFLMIGLSIRTYQVPSNVGAVRMAKDKPVDRRAFFRASLRELIKPLSNAIQPFEKALGQLEKLDRPGAQPAPAQNSIHPGPAWIRPPGAIEEKAFLDTCSRCGVCVNVCPAQCIKDMTEQRPVDYGIFVKNGITPSNVAAHNLRLSCKQLTTLKPALLTPVQTVQRALKNIH